MAAAPIRIRFNMIFSLVSRDSRRRRSAPPQSHYIIRRDTYFATAQALRAEHHLSKSCRSAAKLSGAAINLLRNDTHPRTAAYTGWLHWSWLCF
jgi:hypothetical protein